MDAYLYLFIDYGIFNAILMGPQNVPPLGHPAAARPHARPSGRPPETTERNET